MKRFIYIAIMVLIFVMPVDVGATFKVEEDVSLSPSEINGAAEPTGPQTNVPDVNVDNNEPVTINPTENTKKTSVPANTNTPAAAEKAVEENTEDTESVQTEVETEEILMEEIETEEIETEEVETEMMESESSTEELVEDTEVEIVEDNVPGANQDMFVSGIKKVFGLLCIVLAAAWYFYFLHGRVKLYNFSSDDKCFYIGSCRAVKRRGTLIIYASQRVLERGKTGKYTLAIGRRFLKSNKIHTAYLSLPGQELVEIGMNNEVEFQYR